jgi:hypothetical protein
MPGLTWARYWPGVRVRWTVAALCIFIPGMFMPRHSGALPDEPGSLGIRELNVKLQNELNWPAHYVTITVGVLMSHFLGRDYVGLARRLLTWPTP